MLELPKIMSIENEKTVQKPEEFDGFEPKAVFLVKDEENGERGVEVTLSSWKNSVRSAMNELERLKEQRERVKQRRSEMRKKTTTGTGKRYSSTEKRQILEKIKEDENRVNLCLERNRMLRRYLNRQGKWLLLSPPENPLTVYISTLGDDEVLGKPLDEGRAAWRMFVLQEAPEIVARRGFKLIIREFFILRRNEALGKEKNPGDATKALDEFRDKVTDVIPEELAPVFRKINEFDFRKSPLIELEILRKDG